MKSKTVLFSAGAKFTQKPDFVHRLALNGKKAWHFYRLAFAFQDTNGSKIWLFSHFCKGSSCTAYSFPISLHRSSEISSIWRMCFLGLTLALSLSIYADALSIFLQNWKLFQSRERNGQFRVNTSTGSCSAIIRCFGLSNFPKDQRTLRTTFGWTQVCPKIHTDLCRCHPCSKCPTGSFLFSSAFSMCITLINMQCKLYVDIGSYCGWLHITWLLSIRASFLIILLWFRPFQVGNAIESAMSKNPHHFHRKQ